MKLKSPEIQKWWFLKSILDQIWTALKPNPIFFESERSFYLNSSVYEYPVNDNTCKTFILRLFGPNLDDPKAKSDFFNLDGLFDPIIHESSVIDMNYHMTVYFQKYCYKL